MNFGLEYLGIGRKNISDWRDTHMLSQATSVYMMQLPFSWIGNMPNRKRWNMMRHLPPFGKAQRANIGMQNVSSGPDRKEEYVQIRL